MNGNWESGFRDVNETAILIDYNPLFPRVSLFGREGLEMARGTTFSGFLFLHRKPGNEAK